jgi:hypothetical protein
MKRNTKKVLSERKEIYFFCQNTKKSQEYGGKKGQEEMSLSPASPAEQQCVAALKGLHDAIKVELDADDEDFLNDATYLRFARARDGNFENALLMLMNCCKWRKERKPHRILLEDVQDILGLGTCFCCGTCRRDRPILVMTPGAANPFPAEHRVKLMLFILEETYRLGYEQLTWMFDFSKMGERVKDGESEKTRKELMNILQNFYPERLGVLLMLNTPWYMRLVATVVWPFLDKRTKAKIQMSVKPEHLVLYVDPSQLLTQFGGTLTRDGHAPFPPRKSSK